MDVLCVCCGEPWDVEYVLSEATDEFDREGALIRGCPSCHGTRPGDMTEEGRGMPRVAAAAALLGADVEGLAGLVDDLKAVGRRRVRTDQRRPRPD